MDTFTATQATSPAYELAEGPIWDAETSTLHWVDIPAGAVLHGELRGDRIVETGRTVLSGIVSPGTVGAVGLARDGGLIVATERGFATIDPAGAVHRGPDLLPEGNARRFNDAACDPAGRFIAGTLARGGSDGHELLVRLDPDGSARVLRDDLGLSNGIAFSPSGETVYHVDTQAGIVWAAPYDGATGLPGEWAALIRVTDGSPDGLTVDAEGGLWLAIWGSGEVRRFDAAGIQTAVIRVDAPHSSSVAFIGPDLDTIVITSARDGLTDDELARSPESGALFLARVGIRGLPEHRWAGNTTSPTWGETLQPLPA